MMMGEDDEEEHVPVQTVARRLQVPRRRPKACKQCRASKVRCSGNHPCARCARRRDICVFPVDEPYVSVPVSYLESLERKAAASTASPRPPTSATTESSTTGHVSANGLDHLANASGSPCATDNTGPAYEPSGVDGVSPHNPLIGRSLTYIFDHVGRPRYLGPTSSWGFCRRALALLESTSPASASDRPPAPLNLDGTAFRLAWSPKPTVEIQDVQNLPSNDYAIYLYNTVQYRLGDLLGIIDDGHFMAHLKLFQEDPYQTAKTYRLWFVEFLLVLAFGKAFLNHPGSSTASGPPGSEHAAHAMSLMPDVQQMHDEWLLALEVLSLAALYFQSIDMRASAYQLIGQALRLSYIEGLHLVVPDDVIDPAFARRCTKDWWVVYILDRELTSMFGCPNNQVESEITAALPSSDQADLHIRGFNLRIRLSRLIAKTSSTVYSVERAPGQPFIDNTTCILRQLADVSQELRTVVLSCKQSTQGALPGIFRHVTLSYHHCIVLATRPLVMWLFVLALPPSFTEVHHLASPIEALLHAAADSATSILLMLAALAKRNLLEPFLPFQLESTFSSAMLLSLLGAILPSYIPDPNWQSNALAVLGEMIRARNVAAPLRKSELRDLEELLAPIRRQPVVPAEPSGQHGLRGTMAATPSSQLASEAGLEDQDFSVANDLQEGLSHADEEFLSPPWGIVNDGIPAICDVDFVLGLAEQLRTEDLETSFLSS